MREAWILLLNEPAKRGPIARGVSTVAVPSHAPERERRPALLCRGPWPGLLGAVLVRRSSFFWATPMKPRFWKLSEGKDFSYQEVLDSLMNGLVYVHKDTKPKGTSKKTQGEDFVEALIGDYFYLTHGNHGILLLGQFSGPANLFSSLGDGWLDRPFRLIRSSVSPKPYDGQAKWWAPNHNSTFSPVPDNELAMFESSILEPYFGIKLASFGVALEG